MNNVNENFKKNIQDLRTSMIISLILTILEVAYITYIVYNGIVIPKMRIMSSLLGVHLVINSKNLYIIYKKLNDFAE